MTLLFTYGSLKQGFTNEHRNTGRRLPGSYRTRERMAMVLLGAGHVPCLIHPPGTGHQVVGELYQMDAASLLITDRLERFGETDGYQRIEIALERTDQPAPADIRALVYVRLAQDIAPDTPRSDPLEEYTLEHARKFMWQGAD